MNKKQYIGVIFLFVLSIGVVRASSFVYDEFSGDSLDTTKWNITTVDGFVDEHFIDNISHIYHVAQTFQSGGLRNLVAKAIGHNFTNGETLDFDFNYVNGSGNRAGYFGIYNSSGLTSGLVDFGYWNGEFGIGNIPGLYHYHIEFGNNNVNVTVEKSDNTTYYNNIVISPPYVFGFSVNNGGDGTMHFDYDNFVITEINSSKAPDPFLNYSAVWHFDEGTGNITYDATPYGNNGTVFGAEWVPDGKFGSGLYFDGTAGDYINVPLSDSLMPPYGLTIETWIKTTQNSVGRIINKKENFGGSSYALGIGEIVPGNVWFQLKTGDVINTVRTSMTVNDGQWHYIAATWDRIHRKIYVDGLLAAQDDRPADSIYYDNGPFIIGKFDNSIQFYKGYLDEVRISNIARTSFGGNPPVIDSFSPTTDPTIFENETQVFYINASDPDNQILLYRWFFDGNNMNINSNELIYTASYNSSGIHEITVFSSNGLSSAYHTWNLTIIDVNIPPVLSIPDMSIYEDNQKNINLSEYSFDYDEDILAYSVIADDPSKVGCEISQNQTNPSLKLMPYQNFNGVSSCTIYADDGRGGNATQTIQINVLPVNDPPILNISHIEITEDTPTSIDLSNYSYDAEGDNLTYYTVAEDPSKVHCQITGSVLELIPYSNFNGLSFCTIGVDDDNGGSATSISQILVLNVNDAPILNIPTLNVTEDTKRNISLKYYSFDYDNDTLTYSIISEDPSKVHCEIVYNGANTLLNLTPYLNFNGVSSCTIFADDDHGGNATQTFNINVLPVNDPPVIDPISDITANEGDLIMLPPTAHDVDSPNLTFIFYPPFDINGQWQTDFEDSGFYNISVKVTDGILNTTTYVRITVNNVNRPPRMMPLQTQAVAEGQTLAFIVNATDPDNINSVHNDDNILTFSGILPVGAYIGKDMNNMTKFHWIPNYYQAGSYNITINVTDGQYVDEESVLIIVDNTPITDLMLSPSDIIFSNSEPVENEVVYITATYYNTMEINPGRILVNFYDVVGANKTLIGTYVYDINEGPEQMQPMSDTFVAQMAWYPSYSQHEVIVSLDPYNDIFESDESNNNATKGIYVRPLPDIRVPKSGLVFSNPVPRENDIITIFSAISNNRNSSTGPFHVQVYMDNISNIIAEHDISLGPNNTQTLQTTWVSVFGNHTIFVEADPYNEVVEYNESNNIASKPITVLPTFKSPVITNITNITFLEDGTYRIDLDEYVYDADSADNSLVWSFSGNSIHASIDVNHVATFYADPNWNGFENITLSVKDPTNLTDIKTIPVFVLPVNDAPVIQPIQNISVIAGRDVAVYVNVSDIDSTNLIYSINYYKFARNGTVFTWTTRKDDVGKYIFLINVTDGQNFVYIWVNVAVNPKPAQPLPKIEQIPQEE